MSTRNKPPIPLNDARKLTWPQFCTRAAALRNLALPAEPGLAVRTALSSVQGVADMQGLVNAAILQGFADERDTTAGWVRVVDLPNYLQAEIATVDEPPRLEQVPRGQTAPTVNFGVSSEGWRLARFGAQFLLDEQDLLDAKPLGVDLLAYEQLGRAARRLVPDLVYAVVLSNAPMGDATALFDAGRGNYATAALADTALDAGLAAVSNQIQTDEQGDPIHRGLQARYLVLPGDLVGLGRRLVSNMDTGDPESRLIVRGESRLSAAGLVDPRSDEIVAGTATNWMLACPAEQAAGIVVGAIGGNLTPRIRTFEPGEGRWGVGFDASLSLACTALDAQSLYWSTGAP